MQRQNWTEQEKTSKMGQTETLQRRGMVDTESHAVVQRDEGILISFTHSFDIAFALISYPCSYCHWHTTEAKHRCKPVSVMQAFYFLFCRQCDGSGVHIGHSLKVPGHVASIRRGKGVPIGRVTVPAYQFTDSIQIQGKIKRSKIGDLGWDPDHL